jgi:hypothetical protein
MAKHPTKPLKSRDILGLKYVDRLLPLPDQLHEGLAGATKPAIAACIMINTASRCCSISSKGSKPF